MDKSDTGGQPVKLYRNKETGELFTYREMLEEWRERYEGINPDNGLCQYHWHTRYDYLEDNGTGWRKVRTIDLLYQAYVDERMERAESGEEQEAIRQFRNICSKADNSLMKLQGDIWDSMVQYGDSREKQGFIAGFMMACDLFRTGGTGSYDSKGNA